MVDDTDVVRLQYLRECEVGAQLVKRGCHKNDAAHTLLFEDG